MESIKSTFSEHSVNVLIDGEDFDNIFVEYCIKNLKRNIDWIFIQKIKMISNCIKD